MARDRSPGRRRRLGSPTSGWTFRSIAACAARLSIAPCLSPSVGFRLRSTQSC